MKSSLFDQKIRDMGEWEPNVSKLFDTWIQVPNEVKNEKAPEVIESLLKIFFKGELSEKGIVSLSKIGDTLDHLEKVLSATKGGLIKKFYRDHLNHSLRVLLLSGSIVNNISSLTLDEEEKRLLFIASLFHDFSYPLSNIYEIYAGIISSMSQIYNSANYPEILFSYSHQLLLSLIQNIDIIPPFTLEKLGKELSNNNHSIISSFELLTYIEEKYWENYRKTINAILYHDPAFDIVFKLNEHKVLGLLIICDELQDWGRISSFEDNLTLEAFEDFDINNKIDAKIIWVDDGKLSPLRQIYSKQKSLFRIDVSDVEEFDLNITYDLPKYVQLDIIKFEQILNKILNNMENPELLYQNRDNVGVMDNNNFNMEGIRYEEIYDYIKNYTESDSVFNNKTIFYNEYSNELLIRAGNKPVPQSLKISLRRKEIIITDSDGENSEKLINHNMAPLQELCKHLIREISIIFEVSATTVPNTEIRFWTKDPESFAIKLEEYTCTRSEISYINDILRIGKCFKTNGVFQLI